MNEAPTVLTVPKAKLRTRERLEAAWNRRSDRPIVPGIFSVSMLTKLSAGRYARLLLGEPERAFDPYLGWRGNIIGNGILDDMGIPQEQRELTVRTRNWGMPDALQVELVGHMDGLDFEPDVRRLVVVECKSNVFPTQQALEQAKRQGLTYAAVLREMMERNPGAPVVLERPWWNEGPPTIIPGGEYEYHVQVPVGAAWDPEFEEVHATPDLLDEVLQTVLGQATAIQDAFLAMDPAIADEWDTRTAKDRPVEQWADPPADVLQTLDALAKVKALADQYAEDEEALRATLRDAMRAANVRKAAGSGLSASWVEKELTKLDKDAVAKALNVQDLSQFEKKVKATPAFTVRAAGRPKKEAA